MHFERATVANGRFTRLKNEWDLQIEDYRDEVPVDLYETMMAHALRIAEEEPNDPRYGVFAVSEGPDGPFEGLVHVNHKLPWTSASEVRLVWHLIAPIYQVEGIGLPKFGRIAAGFLTGGLQLCASDMQACKLRMYLGNATDRSFAEIVVDILKGLSIPGFTIKVAGNWLLLTVE